MLTGQSRFDHRVLLGRRSEFYTVGQLSWPIGYSMGKHENDPRPPQQQPRQGHQQPRQHNPQSQQPPQPQQHNPQSQQHNPQPQQPPQPQQHNPQPQQQYQQQSQRGPSRSQPAQQQPAQKAPPQPVTGGGIQTQQTPRPRPRLQPVTVGEIAETDVTTAQPDTPIVDIVADMAAEDVGSVVITEDDTPVGIITDRQIALALEPTADMSQSTADEFLTEDLVTGSTDMSVFDALQRLNDMDVRRLPIVDEDGTLEGIVTLDDIIVLLGTELGNAADIIQAQSPRL